MEDNDMSTVRGDLYRGAAKFPVAKERAMAYLKRECKSNLPRSKNYVYNLTEKLRILNSTDVGLEYDPSAHLVTIDLQRRKNVIGGTFRGQFEYYGHIALLFYTDSTTYRFFLYTTLNPQYIEYSSISNALETISDTEPTTNVSSQQSTDLGNQYTGDDALAWHAINRLAQVIEDIQASRKI
jgi:hypothetical protein